MERYGKTVESWLKKISDFAINSFDGKFPDMLKILQLINNWRSILFFVYSKIFCYTDYDIYR